MKMQKLTPMMVKDSGLAFVLLSLLLYLPTRHPAALGAAIVLLLLTMTAPVLLTPAAHLWFGLSVVMGAVMSRLILTLLFFVMVTPMALLRRMAGKDGLQLRQFKKSSESVFVKKTEPFTPADCANPF